jgi:hypothetical protein
MTLDQKIALFSSAVSFVAMVFIGFQLLFIGLQLRAVRKQQKSDSLVKILDTTRELITLGFSHRELFKILADEKQADPLFTQQYLQLWLNHFSLIHYYLEESMLGNEARANLERDMSEFVAMTNMRAHWQRLGKIYPHSFQTYMNGILKKDEPPSQAAHHAKTAHGHHDAKT